MDLSHILDVKEKLRESFSGIHGGVQSTDEELSRFITMMDPYIKYFFSGKTEQDGFIGDVVLPSEKDLTTAIQSASGIMNSDTHVHNAVYESLVKIMSLQNSVANIVEMLEMIEMYSLNSMVMSAKSGDEGQALAAISGEMARMSQAGSSLSVQITQKMNDLIASLDIFNQIRDKIETLHENSLTTIAMSSKSLFRGLLNEFERLSVEVRSDYSMIINVKETLRKVVEKFQHEDIVRQNLEKAAFAIEESKLEVSNVDYKNDEIIDKKILCMMAQLKVHEIGNDIGVLRSEMGKALNEIHSVVNSFSNTLYVREDNHKDEKSDVLEELFQNLEDMKKQFELYITNSIASKKQMLDFLNHIKDEIDGFSSFFVGILGIAKKFKTVILLTLIELSRHNSLHGLLSGALSDVKQIPNQISLVVSEGQSHYKELILTFNSSLNLYNERFAEQRKVLEESISLMRKVSVQVYESKKYHNDFISETGNKISDVNTLVSDVSHRLDVFSSYGSLLGEEIFVEEEITREMLIDKYSEQMNQISKIFKSPQRSGDYRSMMLASLATEFKISPQTDNSIEYF